MSGCGVARAGAAVFVMFGALLAGSGCVVAIGNRGENSSLVEGTAPASATLQKVSVGTSTRDDVRVLIGEPEQVRETDDGGSIWTWVQVRREGNETRTMTTTVRFGPDGVVREKYQTRSR